MERQPNGEIRTSIVGHRKKIRHTLFIMGSSTFAFDPMKPTPDYRLIVMTRDPASYNKYETPGQIEFTDETPKEIYERCAREGYDQMMVVGGSHIATSFLQDQLIDELWLTLEPRIFGNGNGIVTDAKLDIELRQISCETVNEQGTMITKYAVVKQ
jgi:dihydrofolate reductase